MSNESEQLTIRAKQVIEECYLQNSRCLEHFAICSATPRQFSLLYYVFGVSHSIVVKEFKRLRKNEKMRKQRYIASTHRSHHHSLQPHPFNTFCFKFTNIDLVNMEYIPPRASASKRETIKSCNCQANGHACIDDFETIRNRAIKCNYTVQWDSRTYKPKLSKRSIPAVKECYRHTCSFAKEANKCRNRYFAANHHLHKCVVEIEHQTIPPIWGLRVRKGCTIPEWGVIGEYTGDIIEKGKSNSLYRMELDLDREIDACFRGNNTRFINHCCGELFNTAAVYVVFNQQLTIFIVAVQDIHQDEFLSFNYGAQQNRFFNECLCVACKDK